MNLIKFWKLSLIRKANELEKKFIFTGDYVQEMLLDFNRNMDSYDSVSLDNLIQKFADLSIDSDFDKCEYKNCFLFCGKYNSDYEKLRQRLNRVISVLSKEIEERTYRE